MVHSLNVSRDRRGEGGNSTPKTVAQTYLTERLVSLPNKNSPREWPYAAASRPAPPAIVVACPLPSPKAHLAIAPADGIGEVELRPPIDDTGYTTATPATAAARVTAVSIVLLSGAPLPHTRGDDMYAQHPKHRIPEERLSRHLCTLRRVPRAPPPEVHRASSPDRRRAQPDVARTGTEARAMHNQ